MAGEKSRADKDGLLVATLISKLDRTPFRAKDLEASRISWVFFDNYT
jgi:hypothetical protein